MKKKSILLIDDNLDMRAVVEDALVVQNYSIHFADSAANALQKLSDHSYDLILCDIKMPKMNGLQLMSYLRTELGLKTPVLFISGEINDDYDSQIKTLSQTSILEKPFRLSELREAVQKLLPDVKTN